MQELYFECLRAEAQDDCVRTLGNDQCASAVKATLEYLATKMGVHLLEAGSLEEGGAFMLHLEARDDVSDEQMDEILNYHWVHY